MANSADPDQLASSEIRMFPLYQFRDTTRIEADRKPSIMYRIVNYHNIHQIIQFPFLLGMDLGFMKVLHIFYNLMLDRPFDATFWRISSVC